MPDEGARYLHQALELEPADAVSAAIHASLMRDFVFAPEQLKLVIDAAAGGAFRHEMLGSWQDYPPFGKILLRICDLVQSFDKSNRFAYLYRAVAHQRGISRTPRLATRLSSCPWGRAQLGCSWGQR